MAIKLDMLRSFAAVARHGNLQDAAQELGRTPSAVSMTLKQLEDHLGAPLFETDRKNRLSALGLFVMDQAEGAVMHFANAVDQIEGFASGRLGQVRIAMVPSIAGTLMPGLLARRMAAYQHIALDLRDMDSASVLRHLKSERADLGIATLPRADPSLRAEPLLTDRFGVVCLADHPLAVRGAPVSWDDLDGQQLFANGLSQAIPTPEAQALHRRAHIAAHTMSTILGMIRAKTGITVLPELAVQSFGAPDLAFLPLSDQRVTREIHLLSRADLALAPAVEMVRRDILDETRHQQTT